jgi:hypothetical protein
MIFRFCIVTAVFLALYFPQRAGAKTGEPGITTYSAAFFHDQQPVNAADMVRLLPGFRIQNGDRGVRGYSGSAGNILVDGQRPSSKEESPEAILTRIPAGAVDHIDLIHGGAAGYDMQGYGLLVNVVRSTKVSLRGRVVVQQAYSHSGYAMPRLEGEVDWLGDGRSVNLAGTYYNAIDNGLGYGRRDLIDPDGKARQRAGYAYPRLGEGGQLSTEYRQALAGGQFTLDGLVKQDFWHADIVERVYFPAAATLPTKDRWRQRSGEVLAYYEHALGGGQQIRILASHHSTGKISRNISISPTTDDLTIDKSDIRESILRAVYRRRDGALSLNAGAEGAINIQNSHNSLYSGGMAVTLPAANVQVEEKRGEGFLVGTWRASPAVTAELEMRYETSVLKQSGDSNLTRPLSYAKPRFQTIWRPAPGQELRFVVERLAGQLNFDDFVSSANLVNANVEAGNRDLVPDRTTRIALTWERRFWQRGSLIVTAQRDDVTALVDHVPIFDNGAVLDATGNIGDGQRDQLQANLTMPLDPLCLAGVTVQAEGNLRESDVTDPATGRSRRFSGEVPLNGWISLTHDIPSLHVRWGMQANSRDTARYYMANELDYYITPSRLSAFVEYQPRPQWTVRLFGERIGQLPSQRERTVYDGLRSASAISYVEQRSLNTGMMLGINIQHTFED